MNILRIVSLVSFSLIIMACSSKSVLDDAEGMTAEQLFVNGEEAVASRRYSLAIRRFEALESVYPFSEYAEQAHLELIYAYYQSGDLISAAAVADRYIRLYPSSEHVDYVYYMKGLANFSEDRGIFAKLLPMDLAYRGPGMQTESYNDFLILVTRFPDSPYAGDAHKRLIYLRNLMAQRELNIADFYMERKMYVAAIHRADYIVENYSQAPQVEQALALLVEANRQLKLDESADEALRVLQLNYPNSKVLAEL